MKKHLEIINYVLNAHLTQPYTNDKVKLDWNMQLSDGTVIERPNHGLAHTLRVCSYIPYIIQFLKEKCKNPEQFNFTDLQIEKMQLAMLYAVAGRQNDGGVSEAGADYWTFRELSSEYFKTCFSEYFPGIFTDDFEYFANLILTMGKKETKDPIDIVISIAHRIDLARCYDDDKLVASLFNYVKATTGFEDKASIELLLQHSCRTIIATGDRLFYPKFKGYNLDIFPRASLDAEFCLDQIASVPFLTEMVSLDAYIAEVEAANRGKGALNTDPSRDGSPISPGWQKSKLESEDALKAEKLEAEKQKNKKAKCIIV